MARGDRFRPWLLSLALIAPAIMAGGPALPAVADGGSEGSYVVVYASPSHANRGEVESRGHKVTADLSAAAVMVVQTSNPNDLASISGVTGVAPDDVLRVPDDETGSRPDDRDLVRASGGCASEERSCPLQWDLARIHVPRAWEETRGSSRIKVAVLDTGLRTTHEEVGANFDRADTKTFIPKAVAGCPRETGTIEDGNGHGTWTATHVAGVNGQLMTGIAPRTTLIAVKVLSDCGSGSFAAVMAGMMYANSVGARIESMSLGGYVCADGVVPSSTFCSSPGSTSGVALWQALQNVVKFLHDHGTLVVAAAGNDHVRLGATGRVIANGSLAFRVLGASRFNDLRGLSEAPGGVPGVIAVSALNRLTAAGQPGESRFGQFGVGRRDQLTYYSSYGERIDVSAPGGARNFNVPTFDCLSNNCRRTDPSAPGATDNPADFGAWGVDPISGAPCNNCYLFVQGTSMATPQVAGVGALALAANDDLNTDRLAALLRRSVTRARDPNATPAIASDPSHVKFFNFDLDYGAPGVASNLMGSGVIDAAKAVRGEEDESGDK